MGYMRHHAIVFTGFKREHVDAGVAAATRLGMAVSDRSREVVNGYCSACIFPDGSKEGWESSDKGDEARAQWKAWACAAYRSGVYLDWVEVQYGDDNGVSKVVDTDDADNEGDAR